MPDQKAEVAKGERGVQHPAHNLEAAVAMLEQVRTGIGFNPASRETIAAALGHKGISGSSAKKLGVLTHFDLLERVGGGAYRISDLGKAILIPRDEEERRSAIADAATRPALYNTLLGKYENTALPTLLPNLLSREHGVFPNSSEAAAAVFRETMEFAGLLRQGVLYRQPESDKAPQGDETPAPDPAGDTRGDKSGPTAGTVLAPRDGTVQSYTIALDNAGRLAAIQIPIPVSPRDLKRIRNWIDYMSAVIEDGDASDEN